jgi:hypothetical protein
VGASGWDYRVPYAGSVEATLIRIQEEVLASGDYIWPWESVDHETGAVARPSSLAELGAAKGTGEFWEEGTHTILDIDRVIDTDDDEVDDEVGGILPLDDTELNELFGTSQPSAAEFDRVYEPGPAGPLSDLLGERWTGRSMVIYKDGVPAEIYFWGFSGD